MRTGCVIKEIDHMKPLFLLALSTLPFHLSHAAQPPLELTIQKSSAQSAHLTTRIQWVDLFKQYSTYDIDEEDMIESFEQLKQKFSSKSSDPYKILGVNRDLPFEEIKKVYQRKRREFHPDTLISKGLPEELLIKAKEKFIEIQQAFEDIEQKKR